MARYKRIPQKIGGAKTLTAHRDLSDICPACGGYVLKGQWYVMKGRTAWHYRCKDRESQMPAPTVKVKQPSKGTRAERRRRRAERRKERERVREVNAAQFGDERDRMSRLDHAIGKD